MLTLKKPDDRTRALYWVAKAQARIETRYAINAIEITKTTITATNGRCLHTVTMKTNIPPGLYRVIKARKTEMHIVLDTEAGNFPKWEDIIPAHPHQFSGWDFELRLSAILSALGTKGIFANPKYIEDATGLFEICFCRYKTPDRHIVFASKDFKYRAIVMPISGPDLKHIKVKNAQDILNPKMPK